MNYCLDCTHFDAGKCRSRKAFSAVPPGVLTYVYGPQSPSAADVRLNNATREQCPFWAETAPPLLPAPPTIWQRITRALCL